MYESWNVVGLVPSFSRLSVASLAPVGRPIHSVPVYERSGSDVFTMNANSLNVMLAQSDHAPLWNSMQVLPNEPEPSVAGITTLTVVSLDVTTHGAVEL
eukprot:7391788-Prymnesium_polylepis.1